MRNMFKPLAVAGLLMAGMSTASASADIVLPGFMNDFEDGSTNGWTIAGRSSVARSSTPPAVKQGANSKFLEYTSNGSSRGGANRRLAFYNKSTWAGDYRGIDAITGDVKATSDSEDWIYLRLNFHGADDKFYSSKAFQFATDGEWKSFSFNLKASDYFVQGPGDWDGWDGTTFSQAGDAQFENAISNIHEFKFVSNKDYPQWGDVDAIAATIGMDNITASAAVSSVPVPAAVWLMGSGLLGLIGLSSRKQ